MRSTFHALAAVVFAAVLGACATTTPLPSAGPVVPAPVGGQPGMPGAPGTSTDAAPPAKSAPPPSPLATEKRFLDEWFRGTPVVIAAQAPVSLTVDVPLANSFVAGQSEVRPALNAVLERVAESLKRQIGARIAVSAPSDLSGPPTLAGTRAAKVREALVAKGVASTRIAVAEAAKPGAALQLRLSLPPPAIARLKDSSLPVPATGIKPISTKPPATP
jgi:outer membrane protein OmpA-like peptidoglycan-associated protein